VRWLSRRLSRGELSGYRMVASTKVVYESGRELRTGVS
jgi:hypothetical protein